MPSVDESEQLLDGGLDLMAVVELIAMCMLEFSRNETKRSIYRLLR
jgi:hypothetical protein